MDLERVSSRGGARPALRAAMRCGAASLALVWGLLGPMGAHAAAPKTLLIEGYVHTAAGPVVDGSYTVAFALYQGQKAVAPFWQQVGAKVEVKAGQFAYSLGSVTPLDMAALAGAPEVWLGITVGQDPELPRGQLHAVAFALHAASADVAAGLSCTGCVKSSALVWDGDLDLAGFNLKAQSVTAKTLNGQTVVAQEFVGDGSKLTGLNVKVPSGSCPSGQVVTGIKSDGSLSCIKVTQDAPSGSLEAVSGGILSNEFTHIEVGPDPNVPIPDNTGLEALSTVTYEEIGAIKSLSLSVELANSDLSKVSMVLLPPDDKKNGYLLCDPCGKSGEKQLNLTFPSPTPPQQGNLGTWIGKSAKGTWNLKVKDTGYCIVQLPGNEKYCDVGKGIDGSIVQWSMTISTVSATDISAKGQLFAIGGIRIGGTSAPCTSKLAGSLRYVGSAGLQLCNGSGWVVVAK